MRRNRRHGLLVVQPTCMLSYCPIQRTIKPTAGSKSNPPDVERELGHHVQCICHQLRVTAHTGHCQLVHRLVSTRVRVLWSSINVNCHTAREQ